MYAVVAPGLKGVYEDQKTIDRILALYPYTKFRKFQTEEECWRFLARYENNHGIDEIYNYGETFNTHFVTMEYFVRDSLYYNFRTEKLGYIKVVYPNALVENRSNLIKVKLDNIVANNDSIFGHMIAIYHGLKIIGGFIDVNIVVPDHSVFYAVHSYTGNNRVIGRVKDLMRKRQGKVALTLKTHLDASTWWEDL